MTASMTKRVVSLLRLLFCAALLISWAVFWAPSLLLAVADDICRRDPGDGQDELGW